MAVVVAHPVPATPQSKPKMNSWFSAAFSTATNVISARVMRVRPTPLKNPVVPQMPTAKAPPSLLVHGQADSVYPASQSERLHRRLTEVGARSVLRVIPGADHVFDGYDDVSGLVDECVGYLNRELNR